MIGNKGKFNAVRWSGYEEAVNMKCWSISFKVFFWALKVCWMGKKKEKWVENLLWNKYEILFACVCGFGFGGLNFCGLLAFKTTGV